MNRCFACDQQQVRNLACDQPVLTIGFPAASAAGPNTVTLANGAVVDLVQLGRIISECCPAFVMMGND